MWVSNDERRARVSKGYRKAVFFGRTESSFGLTVLVLVSGVVSQGLSPRSPRSFEDWSQQLKE